MSQVEAFNGRGLEIYPPNIIDISGVGGALNFNVGTTLLDAADEAVSQTFIAPKTGSIDRIYFRTATSTTTGDVNLAIEALASTGNIPSFTKTLFGTNTEVTKNILDTNDNVWLEGTLTAAASVTIGQKFAAVIRNSTANCQFRMITGGFAQTVANMYSATALGAPPTAFTSSNSSRAAILVRYSDGTYYAPPMCNIFGNNEVVTFNSGSATTRAGNRFKLTFPAVIAGAIFAAKDLAAGSAGSIVLRDDSWTSLASGTFDGDDISGTTNDEPVMLYFSTPYTLAKDTWYRLTVEPSTANNISIGGMLYEDATVKSASPEGANFYKTLYTSGAGDDTATYSTLGVFPLISKLDDGAGSGGGLITHPGMGGGMRG